MCTIIYGSEASENIIDYSRQILSATVCESIKPKRFFSEISYCGPPTPWCINLYRKSFYEPSPLYNILSWLKICLRLIAWNRDWKRNRFQTLKILQFHFCYISKVHILSVRGFSEKNYTKVPTRMRFLARLEAQAGLVKRADSRRSQTSGRNEPTRGWGREHRALLMASHTWRSKKKNLEQKYPIATLSPSFDPPVPADSSMIFLSTGQEWRRMIIVAGSQLPKSGNTGISFFLKNHFYQKKL